MEKLIWQKFILGCENLDEALKKGLGGVIFFTKDIESESQIKNKIQEIKNQALIPPFLSLDQEGGRVERTERIYPKRLSAKFAYEKGKNFLYNQSKEISKELENLGFNLNFAPCVDVNTNPKNPIIGERSFSNNPEDVIQGAEIFIKASRENKIIPCIKHFPGHGDADKDSHLTLPKIDLDIDSMERIHIKPFKHLIQKNIEMIMVAHLHCTCFDSEIIPTSLSKNTIKYLRENLNYNGVIISDDMVMQGVEKYRKLEACIKGIEAGLDMFIYRDSKEETLEMIDKLTKVVVKSDFLKNQVLDSSKRISELKQKYRLI